MKALKTNALRLARPFQLLAAAVVTGVTATPSGVQPGTVLLRQLYGDLAVEVRSAGGGAIYIAAADASKSLALILRATDVRQWSDSATRVLGARLRGKATSGRWQALVEEPGVRSGSMMISRVIDGRDTVITLFLADDSLQTVRKVLDGDDARAFIGAIKRAARRIITPASKPPVRSLGTQDRENPGDNGEKDSAQEQPEAARGKGSHAAPRAHRHVRNDRSRSEGSRRLDAGRATRSALLSVLHAVGTRPSAS